VTDDASVARRTAGEESWHRELKLLSGELRALEADIAAARALSRRAQVGTLSFEHHEPPPLRLTGETVGLADGAQIVIRPVELADAGELQRGLEHLSTTSSYRRFRTRVKHLSRDELDGLTRVDHRRHEALVALYPPDHEGIGVARYVCDPADPAVAEVTCVIADAWQERGVGSALVDRLAARARESGVERFVATMLAVDTRSRRLLERVAEPIDERDEDGLARITARLRGPQDR
jgi:RimJ/RimL family protein N-acetyltransferase